MLGAPRHRDEIGSADPAGTRRRVQAGLNWDSAACGHLHDAAYLLGVVLIVLEALLRLGHFLDGGEGTFGDEPAECEFDVVPRRAHRGGDGYTIDFDLERLLNRDGVGACVDDPVAPTQHAASIGGSHGSPSQEMTQPRPRLRGITRSERRFHTMELLIRWPGGCPWRSPRALPWRGLTGLQRSPGRRGGRRCRGA